MAESLLYGGNFKIVFLIDVCKEKTNNVLNDSDYALDVKSRAILLSILRLLLHFRTVNGATGNCKEPLKWGFKFFNSKLPSSELKRRSFYELDDISFELFQEELREQYKTTRNKGEECQTQRAVRSAIISTSNFGGLSCSMTEILHDFEWVTPDVVSPFKKAKVDELINEKKWSQNFVFVVGDSSSCDINFEQFDGTPSASDYDVAFQKNFSPAFCDEFCKKCGLSLFWIDLGSMLLPRKNSKLPCQV